METSDLSISSSDSVSLKPAEGEIANKEILDEMVRAGLVYGHNKSKTHPRFRNFIQANRAGVELVDLVQTIDCLDKAIEFLKSKVKENGLILVVATQPAAKEAIDKLIKEFNFSRINERWMGGLLTNFNSVSSRIEYFKKIQGDLEGGNFGKYTKKERLMISRNIDRMRRLFAGLENLTRLPDAIFVIDPSSKGHGLAIKESRKVNIPIVGIIDSDDNPDLVDYPIPANDHSRLSINWVIDKIIAELKSAKN